MKIVFLFLALVLVTVNGELLLRDDEADERDDALSPFEVFEDIEDIEDRAAKKQKKTKKTKKTKKASTTGDDGDIQGIDERGDALAPFEIFEDIEDRAAPFEASDRGDFNKSYTSGKLVSLKNYYGTKGITLRVLFTFDPDAVKLFKTAGINKFIQLTKQNLDHKTLKKLIGTTIKLVATTRKYTKRNFADTGKNTHQKSKKCQRNKGDWPCTFQQDAAQQTKYYDVYQYVKGESGKNGGGGISNGATVCTTSDKGERISMVSAPSKTDCKNDGYTGSKCHPYRIAKAAKSAAHEIGHTIGMMHDFVDPHKRGTAFTYRTYGGSSCAGGFMSYKNQGKIGWSACSARDFSRFLTKGGTTNPCLNYKTLNKDNRTSCKSTCNGQFKRCVGGLKNRKNRYGKLNGCSGAYTACLSNLNNSNNMYNLTPDCAVKCKPTTTMAALKSKC